MSDEATANALLVREALQRLGFSERASRKVVEQQGIANGNDIKLLKDDDCADICRILRKGNSEDGSATRTGSRSSSGSGAVSISQKAENNFKLLSYYGRYLDRTSRPFGLSQVTADHVQALRTLKDSEKNHEDPTVPALDLRTNNWPGTFETMERYFADCLGTTKIPLSYVIRDSQNVPSSESDPPSNYVSREHEMECRAPHKDAAQQPLETFSRDNNLVFSKLAEMLRNKDCWTYAKEFSRHKNGRAAFHALKNHYLGPNNVDHMSRDAECKLKNTVYTGETRRQNFESYVRIHKEQHTILEGLMQHGYAGMDARTRVRHLLDGIKTPKLESVKTHILATARLRGDFETCVTLFKDVLKQNPGEFQRNANISAVGRRESDQAAWNAVKPDMTVAERYYTKAEYDALTLAQRKGLMAKRKARGKTPGNDNNGGGGNGKKVFSNRQIKALKRMLKDDKGKDKEETKKDDSSVDSDDGDKKPAAKKVRRKEG